MTDPADLYAALQAEIETVLIGNEETVELLTVSLLTGGHVLLEGVPGIAKTTAARLFGRASGLSYKRVQMTPDLLPADVTGTHVYREWTGEFELEKGPVFTNVLLADELNRATPKTQSALLEAMQERAVTIEGDTVELPDPFLVVATQNPIEMEGTFTLPAAQRDRFTFKITLDLPGRGDERELLDRFDDDPAMGPERIEQVVDQRDLVEARDAVDEVYVDPKVKEYILDLVERTREHEDVDHGASPRASLALLNGGKARAAIRGREYVIPDDVKALLEPVFRHRLILSADAELSEVAADAVIADIVERVEAPGSVEGERIPE